MTALGIYEFTAKANEDARQILYINSYSYGWEEVQLQIDGIRENVGDNWELQYEFMESQSVNELTARQMFYDRMEYRMSQEKTYEAVIVSGNAALEFSLEYQDIFFKDIPLVFISVDDEKLIEEAFQRPLVYGVEYAPSIRKNIELAQQVNSNLKKVAAIVDESKYGRKQSQLKKPQHYPGSYFPVHSFDDACVGFPVWKSPQECAGVFELPMEVRGEKRKVTGSIGGPDIRKMHK